CNKMQCFYMVGLMSLHFDRVRSLSLKTIKDVKLISDHKAIADAIAAHDKDAVDAAFAKHMSRFDLDWDIIKKAYSEYITE
ncbi:MAG: FCD domain-containing protein, partial [Clostridiales bacterium]|nr:FCD domain-containing protein [Clostridiales bacterium]